MPTPLRMRRAAGAGLLVAGFALLLLISMLPVVAAVQELDEPPPGTTAADLLSPDVLRGPHHVVANDVRTDGFFHVFSVSSEFGTFEAIGRSTLAVRIHEIGALAELQKVSKTDVFLSAAGTSVVNIGKSAAAVVTDPAGTAKGVGAGVKRFGVNLGRRTQRAVDSATDEGQAADSPAPKGDSASGSAVNSVLGVNAAVRRWAQKVGVDPYTTNPMLLGALTGVAKVDAAGSIATKVALPIPPVVGMTAKTGSLVWGKDPEALRKSNELALRELKVPDAVARKLFGNKWFTLTYQTRLAMALRAVDVTGVADYASTAAEATSEREALFFVESAEMLEKSHARRPVVRVLTDSRAMVASDAAGKAQALLPLDWVSSTKATNTAVREIGARARTELSARQLELVVTGRVSDRAARDFKALGWTVAPR